MILHRQIIKTNSRRIRIRPLGDLQLGEPGFRKDMWERWKRDALLDKDSLILGMGDYSNSFRTTMRKKLSKVLIDDAEAHSEVDMMIMKEMQSIASELKPFQGRFIGLHSGHHNFNFLNGTNSDQYLCQLLKCKYLSFAAGIQLIVVKKCGKTRQVINIFSTHGSGGASYTHSDLANLERRIMPFWDADLFIRGHSTKVYAVPGHPLNVFSNRWHAHGDVEHDLYIRKKSRWLINTGGFMEGWVKDHTSYVEEKNLPPCALGWVVVEIYFPKQIKNTAFEVIPTPVVP